MNEPHIGIITLYCPLCQEDACAYSIMVAQWWIREHRQWHGLEGTNAA